MRIALLLSFTILACGCGTDAPPARQTKMFQAGEKATVGPLTYTVVDTQTLPRLGDDPLNPRVPAERFFLVQVAVSNSGNADAPIPAMTLTDDSGKVYHELADGAGVPNWLGVVRRVGPSQTEHGNVLFDAPATHMKLKVTDEPDEADVFVDLPFNFAHEQLNDPSVPGTSLPPAPVPPSSKK